MTSVDTGITVGGGTQKPKPQEPQQPEPQPQEPQPAAPQEPSGSPQAPTPPPSGAAPLPPADFEDQLIRLIKMRADGLQKSLVDDRGRVLREAMSPEEAMHATLDYLPRYLRSDSGPDNFRNYMAGQPQDYGGMLPNGWVPRTGTVKSIETQHLEDRAAVGREEMRGAPGGSVLLAVKDYVVDPVGNILPAALQVGTDVVVGVLNMLPGGKTDPIDVKAYLHSRSYEEYKSGTTRAELDAIARTASLPAKIVQGSTELIGTAYGFTAGGVGKTLGVGGKIGETTGRALLGRVGAAKLGATLGHAAGVFGAYEGITAPEGEKLVATAKGAASGLMLGAAQTVASVALRSMFGTAVKALGPDEKAAMGALRDWAAKHKLFPDAGEAASAYERRVVDSWISAGLPGAPDMPVRKLIGYSIRGGADAIGFSLIDQQFRQDFLDAAWHGDKSKWESVLTKFGSNWFGAAALAMPLSSIVPRQRRGVIEPTGKEAPPVPDTVTAPEPAAPPPDALQQHEVLRRESLDRFREMILARYPSETAQKLNTGDAAAQTPLPSIESRAVQGAIENVVTLGWEAPAPKSVTVEASGNILERLRQTKMLNPSSPVAKQAAAADGKTALEMRAKDARRFLRDWESRRDEVMTSHGQSTVDAIEAFAKNVAASIGQTLPPRLKGFGQPGEKVTGLDTPGKPLGELYRGDAPSTPEARTGVGDTVRIPDTKHYATIEDGQATLSPSLREALSAPKTMPVLEFLGLAEKASLISALRSKTLPGDEVAIGMKATPGKGDEVGKLRRVVMGEVQESPLSPVPKWETAEVVPLRGKDALEPAQKDAVTVLRGAVEQLPNLDPADRAMLNGAINVLDTVAAVNDPSVAETMQAFPKLVEGIAKGAPGAVKALAESLTTKTPERAMADAQPKPVEVRPVTKEAPLSGEAGAGPGPEMIQEAATRAYDALGEGGKTAGTLLRKPWDYFQRSQIQAVEDLGLRKEAEIGREATTATKRFQTQLDTAGLMDMRRMPRAQLDSMQDLVRDANGGYADRYARAMDAATARHFGDVELTPSEREVVDKGRAVTLEAGRIAEEVGVEQTDSNGKNARPFKVDPERKVLVREFTPEAQQARLTQSGPLYEAMLKWLEATYGWTPQEAARQFTDARSLTSLDATEIKRSIPVLPTHLDVPGHAEPVRILESRPLEHAERLAFRNSQVMGARSVLPRFTPKEGDRTMPQDPRIEPLPPTAQQFVDKILNENGPDAAERAARMVRAMHGLPVEPAARIFTPGERGYNTFRFFDALFGLRRAAALTLSFPMNVAEPVGNAAHFGTQAVWNGYKETAKALVNGGFADLHRQGVQEGFLADTKLNDPWKGDDAISTFANAMKKIGEILTTPLRMTQDFNELVNYVAARDRLTAMRQGEGTRADATALSLLGFERGEIQAMLRGDGTPAQYERYQRNIVGSLAGGKSQRSAERSDAAQSRGFNTLVWFTNFFQARSRAMDRLSRDIAEAPAAEKAEKLWQLVHFAAATAVAGAAGNIVKQYLTGNSDGVTDYMREQFAQSPSDTAGNIVKMIASGIVGGTGQPIMDVFSSLGDPGSTREEAAAKIGRLIGPADAAWQFADYLRALGGVDVPGYANMDMLGKTAKYLRDTMPAARAVHEGLFGLSTLAITDKNVELDNAQDSFNRWMRDNHPEKFKSRGGSEDGRAFRDSMRAVMDRVAAGKTWTDDELVDAVVQAEAARMEASGEKQTRTRDQGGKSFDSEWARYKEARATVAAAIANRKMLPKPGEMTTAEVESLMRHLGEKNVQTLRDYDAVLDVIAKRVKNANLRGQIGAGR